jgi:hypothetical protein
VTFATYQRLDRDNLVYIETQITDEIKEKSSRIEQQHLLAYAFRTMLNMVPSTELKDIE